MTSSSSLQELASAYGEVIFTETLWGRYYDPTLEMKKQAGRGDNLLYVRYRPGGFRSTCFSRELAPFYRLNSVKLLVQELYLSYLIESKIWAL